MVDSSASESDLLEFRRVDQQYRTFRTLIRCAAVVGCVGLGGQALAPLAGKETAIDVAVTVLADLKFAISIVLTGLACVWAGVERYLRHRKTAYLQDRIKKLEERIDPQRSSSGLHRSGRTNPKDKMA